MLKNSLKKCFGYEVEGGDSISFERVYCDHNIVDVVVSRLDGTEFVFEAYDLKRHCFPYEHN